MTTTLHNDLKQLGVTLPSDLMVTCGTSLHKPLPNVKRVNIAHYFGTAFHGREVKQKYSKSQHAFMVGNSVATLYMCYGEWRFGANSDHVTPQLQLVLDQIETLLTS